MSKIPESVKIELFNICRKKKTTEVRIVFVNDSFKDNTLEFDTDGNAKLLTKKISIWSYVQNHINHSKYPIKIFVDGIALDEIEIKKLEHKKEKYQ